MRFPWHIKKERADVARDKERAQNEYEWAVQNRTTVNRLVARLVYHGEQNEIIEKLNSVIRGHR